MPGLPQAGPSTDMEFEHDVFISYAHIDNESLLEDEPGWVTDFHCVLAKRLAQILGRVPRIWRDRELRGSADFNAEISVRLQKSALLVSIVTPRYVRSESCATEICEFTEYCGGPSGVRIGERSRILKVLKTEVPFEEHPEVMRDILGAVFFTRDEKNRCQELSIRSTAHREGYLAAINDLAYEIAESLEIMAACEETAPSPEEAPPSSEGNCGTRMDDADARTIFLAQSTSDLREAHDSLRRGFQDLGIRVLPTGPLGHEADSIEAQLRTDVDQASLSIHMIGSRFGFVPEGSERSVVDLQNEFTAARASNNALSRVIWLPEDVEPDGERQEEFVRAMLSNPRGDLLRGSIESLEDHVQTLLRRDQEASSETRSDQEETRWVYLMHAPEDDELVQDLDDALFDAGFEVRRPLHDGDAAPEELRRDHEENLTQCDGFLLFHGSGGERWLRKALSDVKRARGLARQKPILGKCVWVGPPDDARKKRFRSREVEVLNDGRAFDPMRFASFIDRMKSEGGGDHE